MGSAPVGRQWIDSMQNILADNKPPPHPHAHHENTAHCCWHKLNSGASQPEPGSKENTSLQHRSAANALTGYAAGLVWELVAITQNRHFSHPVHPPHHGSGLYPYFYALIPCLSHSLLKLTEKGEQRHVCKHGRKRLCVHSLACPGIWFVDNLTFVTEILHPLPSKFSNTPGRGMG